MKQLQTPNKQTLTNAPTLFQVMSSFVSGLQVGRFEDLARAPIIDPRTTLVDGGCCGWHERNLTEFERCPTQAQYALWKEINPDHINLCHHFPVERDEKTGVVTNPGADLPCFYLTMITLYRRLKEFHHLIHNKPLLHIPVLSPDEDISFYDLDKILQVQHAGDPQLETDFFSETYWFFNRGLGSQVIVNHLGLERTGVIIENVHLSRFTPYNGPFQVRVRFDDYDPRNEWEIDFQEDHLFDIYKVVPKFVCINLELQPSPQRLGKIFEYESGKRPLTTPAQFIANNQQPAYNNLRYGVFAGGFQFQFQRGVYKRCSVCGTRRELTPQRLKVCGGCRSRFYCRKWCQNEDWKTGHDKECNSPTPSLADFNRPTLPEILPSPTTSESRGNTDSDDTAPMDIDESFANVAPMREVDSDGDSADEIIHIPSFKVKNKSRGSSICSVCNYSASCASMSQCSRCKTRKYCSKRCQVLDWEAGHKENCK